MADIFISYSKQDQDLAQLLAAFLEAEGYSVWWDTNLLSGENFRKTIMIELGRSRAVIVIWTENSIHSDWVQSEAGRAQAHQKLIPVKAKGLPYRDIPPPFDNMHTENLANEGKILAAVVAQLANPEVQRSALDTFTKRARFEFLSWFGIVGATVSLVVNLQGMLTLAGWLRSVVESWTLVLKYFWTLVLFFLPEVAIFDAIMLTIISFAILNMVMSLRKNGHINTSRRAIVFVFLAAVPVMVVFSLGAYNATEAFAREGFSYYSFFVFEHSDFFGLKNTTNVEAIWIRALVWLFIIFFGYPIIVVIAAYLLLRLATTLRLNVDVLCVRLWRIVAGVTLLIILNYAFLWIEQQSWTAISSHR